MPPNRICFNSAEATQRSNAAAEVLNGKNLGRFETPIEPKTAKPLGNINFVMRLKLFVFESFVGSWNVAFTSLDVHPAVNRQPGFCQGNSRASRPQLCAGFPRNITFLCI